MSPVHLNVATSHSPLSSVRLQELGFIRRGFVPCIRSLGFRNRRTAFLFSRHEEAPRFIQPTRIRGVRLAGMQTSPIVKRIVDLCVFLFFIAAAVLAVGGTAGLGWMWGRGVAEIFSLNELAGQIVGTLLGTIAGIGLLGIAYYHA
jgi:hypothetical protein